MKKVIEVSSKRLVQDGPQLWVSQILHHRGCISTTKIWDEYKKDNSLENPDMIPSKTWLKKQILHQMVAQGKV